MTRENVSVLGKLKNWFIQVVLVNEQIEKKKKEKSLYSGIFSLSLSSLNKKKAYIGCFVLYLV